MNSRPSFIPILATRLYSKHLRSLVLPRRHLKHLLQMKNLGIHFNHVETLSSLKLYSNFAALNKGQVNKLLSLIICIVQGDAHITLKNECVFFSFLDHVRLVWLLRLLFISLPNMISQYPARRSSEYLRYMRSQYGTGPLISWIIHYLHRILSGMRNTSTSTMVPTSSASLMSHGQLISGEISK